MPYAALVGDRALLRDTGGACLGAIGLECAVLRANGVPRALTAAGEADLLAQLVEAVEAVEGAGASVSWRVLRDLSAGLLALLQDDAGTAVRRLRAAVAAEREFGWGYRAACLELELAHALAAAGSDAEGQAARARAAAVLEPLGAVHPY
jgi:hypothetical protein